MDRAEVVRMAREAGLTSLVVPSLNQAHESPLERFAALVAAAEQERAAKVCDDKARRNYPWGSENSDRYHAQADWAEHCAAAIRALD